MTRRWRIIALSTLAGLALLPALAALWLAALRLPDPVGALRRATDDIRVLGDSAYPAATTAGEARIFRDLTLAAGEAGTIRLTTSRPADAGIEEPLPLVIILAGLRTGRESLGVLAAHGPNLLVGYQYPYDQETWYQRAPLTQVPAIRRAALDVPAQVAAAARWLASQPHVDADRSALLGYSFGAMFVPAAQRLASEQGHAFHASVLAFGGADIQRLLDANLRIEATPVRRAVAWTAASLLHPLEPEHHLPHLSGRFLHIRGASDRQVPAELSERLAHLTPEPRDVITLDAGHMNPRDPDLTQEVVRISQEWLLRQGVVEPPDST